MKCRCQVWDRNDYTVQVSRVRMTTLTTTRMLLAMVAVKVVMMTVMILVVVTRRMTMTTTKYGPRDRGHEFFTD